MLLNFRIKERTSTAATETEIGEARVYNFSLTDGAQTDLSTSWDLYLFDIQTFTTINLNGNTTNIEIQPVLMSEE